MYSTVRTVLYVQYCRGPATVLLSCPSSHAPLMLLLSACAGGVRLGQAVLKKEKRLREQYGGDLHALKAFLHQVCREREARGGRHFLPS